MFVQDRHPTFLQCLSEQPRYPIERLLKRLRCDLTFLAASGLDPEGGASTTEVHEAAVKSELMERSRRSILVADVSECRQPAALTFAGGGPIRRLGHRPTGAPMRPAEPCAISSSPTN